MRNEEELYTKDMDPGQYYVNHILPKKLRIDSDYVNSRTLLKDVAYLFRGLMITITGAITRRHLFENSEQITLFVCDTFVCAFSYSLAYFLRLEGELTYVHEAILLQTLPYVIIGRICTLTYFGLYSSLIQYFSFRELVQVVKGVSVSSFLIVILTFLIGERSHPRSVFAIDWFILVFFLGGYRLSFKAVRDNLRQSKNSSQKNMLIYGAGNTGDLALRYLRMQDAGNIIGFVDDDPKKTRKRFHGVKILGNRYDIESLVRLYHIDQIFLAMNEIDPKGLEHIKSLCEKAGVSYEIFALAN
jgi:UDP-GlcNAc:undecaprenyl-phosphate GlcNAc-1-phosphate transferase